MLTSCSGPPWISPRRGQVVLCPAAFCSLFLGTFAAIEEEVNPATTPRDTLTIYCNTALCVKAQLNHTETKPPRLLPPWTISPVGSAHAACCPVLGGCSGCPIPTGRGPLHVLCPKPALSPADRAPPKAMLCPAALQCFAVVRRAPKRCHEIRRTGCELGGSLRHLTNAKIYLFFILLLCPWHCGGCPAARASLIC